MSNKTSQIGSVLSVLVLYSSQVTALPFAPVEPRSFAMGGAGVASASSASAVVLNPALLAINAPLEQYELSIPVLGYRLADQEKMQDRLSTYQDNGLEAAYDEVLNDFKAGNYINNDVTQSRQAIIDTGSALGQQLSLLADKRMQGEVVAGMIVGIPSQSINMSLSMGARVLGGAQVNVTDNDLNELLRVVNAANDGSLSATETFDSTQLTSTMQGRGLIMREVALSLAQTFDIAGHDVAIGITPKYLDVTSFDYEVRVNEGDLKTGLGRKEHSALDMDIGMAKQYGNGWGVGLSLKNLASHEYETVRGNTIKVKPQARIGIAHATPWTITVLDLDLNESKSLGYDSDTRYLAFGSELNVFEKFRVRIGYRHNMADTATSLATTGIGWRLLGGVMDLAVGANEDEIAYSAQYGIQF